MRRMLGVLGVTFTALLLLASAASAQTSNNTSVGGSDTTPDQGQTITVSGTGCPANTPVGFFFDGTPDGGTTSDANGNFSGPLTVPSNASSGTHTITATCGAVVMAFEITVSPTVATAPLARTGTSSTFPLTSAALALLGAGGLLVLFARRRRAAHVHA